MEAIIIKTQVYGESDVIPTLLHVNGSKYASFARGARRSRKRFPGGLEVFDIGIARYGSGRHDPGQYSNRGGHALPILSEFNRSQRALNLSTSLEKIACASVLLESLDLLTPENDLEDPRLFDITYSSIQAISNSQENKEIFRCCHLALHQLLVALGYEAAVHSTTNPSPPSSTPSKKNLIALLNTVEYHAERTLKTRPAILCSLRSVTSGSA